MRKAAAVDEQQHAIKHNNCTTATTKTHRPRCDSALSAALLVLRRSLHITAVVAVVRLLRMSIPIMLVVVLILVFVWRVHAGAMVQDPCSSPLRASHHNNRNEKDTC